MYVITTSHDLGSDVPIGALEAKSDMEALMVFQNNIEEYLQKAKAFFFGNNPDNIALWNVTAESYCVTRI